MPASVETTCAEVIKRPGMISGCNTFVQAVAAVYGKGAAVAGNADAIRAGMESAPFKPIGKDPGLATQLAAQGKLVLGALSHTEMTYKDKGGHQHTASMGHVVVVVPGGPSKRADVTLASGKVQHCRGGYPYCYQGAAHAPYRIAARVQVDAVFPSSLLNDVYYAYLDT